MSGRYDDILTMPHPELKHARMPVADRAAQFSPFAALTGHEAAIEETARLTDARIELDEAEMDILGQRLRRLADTISVRPQVTVGWFCKDERKEGGEYRSVAGIVVKADEFHQRLVMEDGTNIPFATIISLEGELFDEHDIF